MKKLFSKLMLVAMAAMTFTACEDVPEPYPVPQPTPEEEITYKGSGTLESPYTCDDVIKYVQSLDGEESENEVYVKGIVTEVTEEFTTNFGNGTFKMSDDGAPANEFTAYRVLYLGNKKYSSGKTQVKAGDEVIVCGRVVNYRGNTPETVQNTGYLYSLNGVTEGGGGGEQPKGEPKGDGTLQNPFNATAANAYASALAADAKSDKDIYVKGKIISIDDKNQFSTQYGNCTFYISDDGTEAGDKFYVFRTLYLGNVKYTSGTLPKAGDEVIICGKVTNFKGNTPETVQNESYIYSLNGETGGGQQQETKVVGSIDQPVTTTDAVKVIEKLSDGATTEEYYYVKGVVTSIKTSAADISKYKNIDYFIADEAGSNYVLQIFRGKNLDNTDFTSADQLQVGDEVIVYGQLMKYVNDSGVIPEMAQGNYLVKRNGSTEGGGGGDTPQPGGEVGEIDGNTITAAMSAWGLEDKTDLTTLKLKDGTTLTFAQNEGRNKPMYYAGDSSARIYALNSVKVSSDKAITQVVLTCVNKDYVGNETLKAEVTDSSVQVFKADTQVTFSGFNGNAINIINDHTGNSGGTQLRIVSIQITYAE
ncbi:MAG: hypothetical protein II949_00765 [Prevotella sp.]|nr:hypothetical protein [Prevotella sp.]